MPALIVTIVFTGMISFMAQMPVAQSQGCELRQSRSRNGGGGGRADDGDCG